MIKPLVYIAAPYSTPDPVENTHRVIKVGSQLVDDGKVTPVLPHLTMLWHTVDPRPLDFWYKYDLEIMERCDAVLRLPGKSSGADNEVRRAEELGIPVFDSVDALYWWVK